MIFYSWAIIIVFRHGTQPWNQLAIATLKLTSRAAQMLFVSKTPTFSSKAKSVWRILPVMNIHQFLTSFRIMPSTNILFHSQNSTWKIQTLELRRIQCVMHFWIRASVWKESNALKYMRKMLKIVNNPRKETHCV